METISPLRESEAKPSTTSEGKKESNDQHYIIKEANKEINKLKCCLEDYTEMEIVKKRAENTIAKLSDLASLAKELKIDWGMSI